MGWPWPILLIYLVVSHRRRISARSHSQLTLNVKITDILVFGERLSEDALSFVYRFGFCKFREMGLDIMVCRRGSNFFFNTCLNSTQHRAPWVSSKVRPFFQKVCFILGCPVNVCHLSERFMGGRYFRLETLLFLESVAFDRIPQRGDWLECWHFLTTHIARLEKLMR